MVSAEDVGLEAVVGEAEVEVVVVVVAAEAVGVVIAAGGVVAGSGLAVVAEQFPCVRVLSAGVAPGC